MILDFFNFFSSFSTLGTLSLLRISFFLRTLSTLWWFLKFSAQIVIHKRNIAFIPNITKIFIVCFLVSILFISNNAFAGIDEEIKSTFNGMINTTSPDAYTTERRGVFHGGSVVARNQIKEISVLNFTKPHAGAGCAGMDLYGGSFSYINKEEFVNFLRTVAGNSQGYAFQIALSSMCEKCAQQMDALQRKVQELNQYLGNSCQLAQGIVNDSLGAMGRKGLNDASLIGHFEGIGDAFEMGNAKNAQEIYNNIANSSNENMDSITGNIVWSILNKSLVYKNNTELKQTIMSLTGTVIQSTDSNDVKILPGKLYSLEDLVNGGKVKSYVCNTYAVTGCLNPSTVDTKIKGLREYIITMFNGTNDYNSANTSNASIGSSGASSSSDSSNSSGNIASTNIGIINKLHSNSGSLTKEEINFVNSIPSSYFAMIRNIAEVDVGSAKVFVKNIANSLALEYAHGILENMFVQINSLVHTSDSAYIKILKEQVQGIKDDVNNDILRLSMKYGNDIEIHEYYNTFMENLQVKNMYPY